VSSVALSRKSRRFRFETVDFKMELWECNFGKVGESRIRAQGGLDADELAFSKLWPYEGVGYQRFALGMERAL
jgi:hypothetical protein